MLGEVRNVFIRTLWQIRETYVVFPAKLVKSDRVDVLVKDEGEVDENAEDGKPLGTYGVG